MEKYCIENDFAAQAELAEKENARKCTYCKQIEFENSWQPIESAPKNGTELLGFIHAKRIELIWFFAASSQTQNWLDTNGKVVKPTHWMPLPPANHQPRNDTWNDHCNTGMRYPEESDLIGGKTDCEANHQPRE